MMQQHRRRYFDFANFRRFLTISLVCLLYCRVISCLPPASEEIDDASFKDLQMAFDQIEISDSQREYMEELSKIIQEEFNMEDLLTAQKEEMDGIWNDMATTIGGLISTLEPVFSPKFEELTEDNLVDFFKTAERAGKVGDRLYADYEKELEDREKRFNNKLKQQQEKIKKEADVRIAELNMRQSRELEDNLMDYRGMSEKCEQEYNTCFLQKIQDLNLAPIDVKTDCWKLSTTCQNEYYTEVRRLVGDEYEKCEKLINSLDFSDLGANLGDNQFHTIDMDELTKCTTITAKVAAHFFQKKEVTVDK